jgi:hypothetical protein
MGINSVLCFIIIKVIITYQHEGPLLAHLMIDIDIVPWEEASRWQAVFFISIVDRVNYQDRMKYNWPFTRPPRTVEVNLALRQTSPYCWSQSGSSPDLPVLLKSIWLFARTPPPQQTHMEQFLLIFYKIKTGKFLRFLSEFNQTCIFWTDFNKTSKTSWISDQ